MDGSNAASILLLALRRTLNKNSVEVRQYASAMHRSRKSRPLVPLGIKEENAVAGDHLALFYETEEEFTNALGFIETGLNGTDHCIVSEFPPIRGYWKDLTPSAEHFTREQRGL